MTTKQKEIIEKCVELVALLLDAAREEKPKARKYTKARAKIEQAMKLCGDGIHRKLERPQSVGLPVHEKLVDAPPVKREEVGDILADNLDEQPKKRRRNGKSDLLGTSDFEQLQP